MSNPIGKYFSVSYDNTAVDKSIALKNTYMSVRLIKDVGYVNPKTHSYNTNILLNGNCIDAENRKLYVFYVDTFYGSAWIIEIGLDDRVQTVVYYDKYNAIGFNPLHKIYNARVVHGRIIFTDNLNSIYQIDIERARKSFLYGIGYGAYSTSSWLGSATYYTGKIVSYGKYFYKALVSSTNVIPGTDEAIWKQLCLIEDAYYSMNIKNFYFAPMPPKMSPTVEYVADDTRKINSLKHTLFQFAYRYVYMDWRKSTIGPASVVPLPQAEEETATALANEQISLNNSLKITVNTGGEEVRAIEVLARSSDDPSTWYLIETIEKFTTEERQGEFSSITLAPMQSILFSILLPTVTNLSVSNAIQNGITMNIILPNVVNSWVDASAKIFNWFASQYGSLNAKQTTFFIPIGNAWMVSKPDWLTIRNDTLEIMSVNDFVYNGEVIELYPSVTNLGIALSGTVEFINLKGDRCSFIVSQDAVDIPLTVTIRRGYSEVFNITSSIITAGTGSDILAVNIEFAPSVGNVWKLFRVTDLGGNILYTGTGINGIRLLANGTAEKDVTLSRVLLHNDTITVQVGSD